MAITITKTDVLLNISRLMGKKNMPGGTSDDWLEYGQAALDYAWRYYQWNFSLAVLENYAPGTKLPDDFDLDAWRRVYGTTTTLKEATPADYARTGGTSTYTLMWDTVLNGQTLKTQGGGTVSLLYQRTPPDLTDDTAKLVPFPSVLTIAVGAIIFAKQAANPSRADVSQEWDQFHSELDRHVGRADRNRPRSTARNLYEQQGISLGEM